MWAMLAREGEKPHPEAPGTRLGPEGQVGHGV